MRQTLISWAATSCFLILAVVALRAALGKRMGAGLRYALWGLVLVRLLVPVQLFTSPVVGTVIDSERVVIRQTQTEREVLDALGGQDGPSVTVTAEPVLPSPPDLPEPPDAPDWRELPTVLGWLWLAGGAVLALVLLGCNLRFWVRLRRTRRPLEGQSPRRSAPSRLSARSCGTACHRHAPPPFQKGAYGAVIENGPIGQKAPLERGWLAAGQTGDCLPVYVAEGLPSPCLFGVFRPAIYVAPETAADPAALRHVLAHEGTHYRHGDHLWSLLRCIALCVHWWNPLVWLAAKLSRRDGELACDEGALKRLGDDERTAYGNTLLALVTAKATPGDLLTCSTAMTGDKKSLKERFARIARAPKRAAGIGLAAVGIAALVTVCAFGQKTSAPASWEELDADLSLSMEREGTVRITGSVDGMELPRGAFWYSSKDGYDLNGTQDDVLTLVYPPFSDGIEGQLRGWWADEEHTAVNLSTYMMAALSSYFPSCYWEFTVDFSGGGAVVSRMERSADRDLPDGTVVKMYPETISDEKAIRAGRIAARPLTAAEEYYRDWEEKGNVPVEPEETAQPPAPSEDPASVPASARAELRAALLGATDFVLYRENGMDYTPYTVDITTAPPRAFDALSEEWEKYNSFTVLDLDGDGVEEVVYHVTDVAGDAGGYLVLRWAGPGDVRCYPKSLFTTRELKADGSFDIGYMGAVGSARLSFPEPGDMFREEPFLMASSPSMNLDAGDATFLIGGESVTQEEFGSAWEKQHEKPDAVWYDFTPENVGKALAPG